MLHPRLEALASVHAIAGDTPEQTLTLRNYLFAARVALRAQPRYARRQVERFGIGLAGVVAVFGMRARLRGGSVEDFWVVAGDPPAAVFPLSEAHDPFSALEAYLAIAERWAAAVLANRHPLPQLHAIAAPHVARDVAAKVASIRHLVLPSWKIWHEDQLCTKGKREP